MKQHWLIIGSSGQDGTYLTNLLLEEGHSVTGVSRRSNDKIRTIQIDLENQLDKLLYELKFGSYTHIAYLAALHGASSISTNQLTKSSINGLNFEVPKQILATLADAKADQKIFFASSSQIFPAHTFGKTVSESSEHLPQNGYAIAKSLTYFLQRFYRLNYGLNTYCGHFFNHESPLRDSKYVTKNIAQQCVNIYLKKSEEIMLRNAYALVDWHHASDAASAIIKIMEGPPADFVIGSGKVTSVEQYCKFCMDYLNVEAPIISESSPPKQFLFRQSDPSKLMGIGWRLKWNVEDIAKEMCDHVLSAE